MATLTPQEKSKVDKYLVVIAQHALALTDKFYLIVNNGTKIDVPGPFRKAVDVALFPTYPSIVKDPMDMQKMKKRIDNFKSMYLNAGSGNSIAGLGGQFIMAVIRDMELIRTNAHAFNADAASADVRFMSDYLKNFFCYCLRVFLKLLQSIALYNECYEKYNNYIFNGNEELNKFMKEEPSQDTRAYLSYPSNRSKMMSFIEQQALVPSILGPNRFPEDLRRSMAVICEIKPPDAKNSFFSVPEEPVNPAPAASTGGKKQANRNAKNTTSKSTTAKSDTTLKISLSTTEMGLKSPGGKGGNGSKRKLDDLAEASTLKVPQKKRSNAGKGTSAASASYDAYDDESVDIDAPTGETYLVDQRGRGSGTKYAASVTTSVDEDYNEGYADLDVDDNEEFTISFSTGPGSKATGRKSTGGARQSTGKRQSSVGGGLSNRASLSKLPPLPPPSGGIVDERIDRTWYKSAEDIIKQLLKHPYIDTSRPTVAADFLVPVIETNALITEVYLSRIEEPMDFRTLQDLLATSHFYHPDEFYSKLRLIFENAIEFNMDNIETSDYIRKMVDKSSYLLDFVRWLCLEKLPLVDDSNGPESEAFQAAKQYATEIAQLSENHIFLLTTTERSKARKQREETVFASLIKEFQYLPSATSSSSTTLVPGSNATARSEIQRISKDPVKDCKLVIQDMLRFKGKKEEEQVALFIAPVNIEFVPDYMVFVREPMDLSTLHYRLDGTRPTNSKIDQVIDKSIQPGCYETYGEFFADCRSIYENAIVYNKAHLETDNTGFSKNIYEVALQYLAKLNDIVIPKCTLTLVDRISVCRYLLAEDQAVVEEMRRKEEEMKRSQGRLLQQLIEEKKAIDVDFAMDINPELKRQRTELELKEKERAAKKALIAQSNTLYGNQSPMDDMSMSSSPPTSPDHLNQVDAAAINPLATSQLKPKLPLIFGYDVAGNVPKRFEDAAKDKEAIAKRAWSLWPPIKHVPVSHLHSRHHHHAHHQQDKKHAPATAGVKAHGLTSATAKVNQTGTKASANAVEDNKSDDVNKTGENTEDTEVAPLTGTFSKIVVKKKTLQRNQQVQQLFEANE